ncbi:hypothetical protein OG216_12460 [Streptomycetaceae bacterium NBC_01309]
MDRTAWGLTVVAASVVVILVGCGALRLVAMALVRRVPEMERRAMALDITVYQAANWPGRAYGGSGAVSAGARVLIGQGLLHISRYGVVTPAAGADDRDADSVGRAILWHVRYAQRRGNAHLYDCYASVPPAVETQRLVELQRTLRRLEERGARFATAVAAVAAVTVAVLIAASSTDSKWLVSIGVAVFGVTFAGTSVHDLAPTLVGRHWVHTPRLDAHCRSLVDAALNPHDDEDVRAAVALSCTKPTPVPLVHPDRRKVPDRNNDSDSDGCDGCGCGGE